MLNNLGEEGQLWRTPLLISASFDSLELNYINILFCVYMSIIAFNISSEIIWKFFSILVQYMGCSLLRFLLIINWLVCLN